MTRLANDPNAIKIAERERKQALDDLAAIAKQPGGLRFLHRLLTSCGVFRSSMTGNSHTFFLEGQRSIGLTVISDLGAACPDALVTLIRQANEQERTDG